MSWIRLATEEDIAYVAPRMRQADKDEVWASGGYEPEEALRLSYRASRPCFAGVNDKNEPSALFGAAPLSDNVGAVWLLGTNSIDTSPISFLRWSKKFFPYVMEPYDMVCNLVHAENAVHIKWLRWLGFSFLRKVKHGPEQQPFYEFARLSNV